MNQRRWQWFKGSRLGQDIVGLTKTVYSYTYAFHNHWCYHTVCSQKRIAQPSAPWACCSVTTLDKNLSSGKQSTTGQMVGNGDTVCRPSLPPICPSQEELPIGGQRWKGHCRIMPPTHGLVAEGEISLPEVPKHGPDTFLFREKKAKEAANGWTEESVWHLRMCFSSVEISKNRHLGSKGKPCNSLPFVNSFDQNDVNRYHSSPEWIRINNNKKNLKNNRWLILLNYVITKGIMIYLSPQGTKSDVLFVQVHTV